MPGRFRAIMREEDNIKNKYKQESFIRSFNPWFIISVVVTILLIGLLFWQLQRSSRVIREFEEMELALQRASGDLLYHSRSLELTAFLAAVTGDLTWQERYEEHRPELEKALANISELAEIEEVAEEIDNIERYLNRMGQIEREVFELISHGNRPEAEERIKGWTYTRQQHEFSQSIDNITVILEDNIQSRLAEEQQLINYLQIVIIGALMLLVISWYISFGNWRENVKERREKEERITYLSFHDPLTDIYNRRYFMEAGEEEIKRVQRYEDTLSVLMLDIDHFKKVNDTYGHPAGDAVLENLASLLKNKLRDVDIPGRLGGEEFGILMPNTNKEQALKAADRIRKIIEENTVEFEGEEISITVSVGIAVYREEMSDIDELLQEADRALYQAKKRGRNCTVNCEEI